jgi:rod shape-determining protein MreC
MKDRGRIVIYIATAVIVILLISSGHVRNTLYGLPVMREGFFWVQGAAKAPFIFSARIFNNYVNLVGTKKENAALKKKLAEITSQKMALSNIRNENDRLRKMLGLKQAWPDVQLLGADIIAQDISLMYKTVILDKGSKSGFYIDMPVIQPLGLMGRVISISADTSQVLLITDVSSAVPSVVENSRINGIIKGLGNGKLSFDYVRSDEEIKPGDMVITSGLLEIFPKGLLIGTVRSIKRLEHEMFAEIIVEPLVRFDKTEEVFGVGRILEKKR